jgi:hypothetical protein
LFVTILFANQEISFFCNTMDKWVGTATKTKNSKKA